MHWCRLRGAQQQGRRKRCGRVREQPPDTAERLVLEGLLVKCCWPCLTMAGWVRPCLMRGSVSIWYAHSSTFRLLVSPVVSQRPCLKRVIVTFWPEHHSVPNHRFLFCIFLTRTRPKRHIALCSATGSMSFPNMPQAPLNLPGREAWWQSCVIKAFSAEEPSLALGPTKGGSLS